MVKVKMNVQTTYNNQLLRAGKVYEVAEDTAQRWHMSNIAIILDDNKSDEA